MSNEGCGCVSFMGAIGLLAAFVWLNYYTDGWAFIGLVILVVLTFLAKGIEK